MKSRGNIMWIRSQEKLLQRDLISQNTTCVLFCDKRSRWTVSKFSVSGQKHQASSRCTMGKNLRLNNNNNNNNKKKKEKERWGESVYKTFSGSVTIKSLTSFLSDNQFVLHISAKISQCGQHFSRLIDTSTPNSRAAQRAAKSQLRKKSKDIILNHLWRLVSDIKLTRSDIHINTIADIMN